MGIGGDLVRRRTVVTVAAAAVRQHRSRPGD